MYTSHALTHTVPVPVLVSVVASTTDSLTVTWSRPNMTRGLITSYDITAVPVSTVGLTTPLGSVSTISLVVSVPEMVLMATLSGLEPATCYQVTSTAFTRGGGASGPPTLASTRESGEQLFVYTACVNYSQLSLLLCVSCLFYLTIVVH